MNRLEASGVAALILATIILILSGVALQTSGNLDFIFFGVVALLGGDYLLIKGAQFSKESKT